MPKSIIREFDNSTTGSIVSSSFSVLVPGYMNPDRKICFSSCVGGYKIIDEIPAEFSVLDYMRKHDKKSIKTIIDNFIKNMKYDKMITNVYY